MTPYPLAERTAGSAAADTAQPDDDAPRSDTLTFSELLSCPSCRAPKSLVTDAGSVLRCPECSTRYPAHSTGDAVIGWLFRQPDIAELDWSARYKSFLRQNAAEYNRLNRALVSSSGNPVAGERIQNAMCSRRQHREQVEGILAVLQLDRDDLVPAVTQSLQDRLPRNQGLASYADNVFRDWAWNNGESDALLYAAQEVLSADHRDSIGRVLTLGAGACRLSYDLHRACSPKLSVALDHNPLLLLIGSRVIHGNVVPLYEFPLAPIDDGISGVLQQCSAPAPLRGNEKKSFEFVLGDASRPPFLPGSFDTVVTPWIIDIIPQDLPDFLPEINRLLPMDGIWLNTGSLAFLHEDPQRRYTEVEVFEIAEQSGFEIVAVDRRTVSYLQSPHSAHGRTERITSFIARKTADVECRPWAGALPIWLTDITRPVPGSDELVVESSSYLLAAQVLAAVDGKRSIHSIAAMVAREYSLTLEECTLAVTRILADAFDGSNSEPGT